MSNGSLVNGIYPADYLTLSGVSQVTSPQQYFWASRQRFAAEDPVNQAHYVAIDSGGIATSEYLEIDMGRVRGINHLNMLVMAAPIKVTIWYDAISDDTGFHEWVKVSPIQGEVFDDFIQYNPNAKNPFFNARFFFSNRWNKLVLTRYLRIQFERRDEEWPHRGAAPFRWPIIVKNLRVVRNVNSYGQTAGVIFDTGPSTPDTANQQLMGISATDYTNPAVVSSDWVCQQFGLPSDFLRGGTIAPNLQGLSVLVYVEPTSANLALMNADQVQLQWELWNVTDRANPTRIRWGVQTGSISDGRTWVTVYLDDSEPVESESTVDQNDVEPLTPNSVLELRIKSNSVNVAGTTIFGKVVDQPNAVPGQFLGLGVIQNGSSTIFLPNIDMTASLQNGDVVQRCDRFSGVTATVDGSAFIGTGTDIDGSSTTGTIIPLTTPYNDGTGGTSAAKTAIMRVTSIRYGIAGTPDFSRSLGIRLLGDVVESGIDVLGNLYRYGTRRRDPDDVFDDSEVGWSSAPQPAADAVEAMYFDVRSRQIPSQPRSDSNPYTTTVIDAIRIKPRTPGVQMYVYYTESHLSSDTPQSRDVWDKMVWKPAAQRGYTLNGNTTILLPSEIRASFVKIEFTNLRPLPYQLPREPKPPAVTYRTYPTWIEAQFQNSTVKRVVQDWFTRASRQGIVKTDYLKFISNPVLEFQYKEREFLAALATNKPLFAEAVNAGLVNTKTNTFIDPTTASLIHVQTNGMYGSPLTLSVNQASVLGQQVAAQQNPNARSSVVESAPASTLMAAPFVSTSHNRVEESFAHIAQTPMWFNRECRHIYKVQKAEFNGIAYQVGIADLQFLRKDYTVVRDEELIINNMFDDGMMEVNTWNRETDSKIAQLIGDDLANPNPVKLYVTYTVDNQTVTDEPVTLTSLTDVESLQVPGTTQATNVIVYLQDGAGNRAQQFYLGLDYDLGQYTDDFGSIVTTISCLQSSTRLFVSHINVSFDADTVIAEAIISSEDS